jgi:Uma2 family endonuclease
MSVSQLVSVNEYLSTSYRPDCDYVDGVVLERNLGEYDHGRLQDEILACFRARREEWGVRAVPEQRVQVSPTRFRVPDICVVIGKPTEQIFRTPPFICIEILSKDDRISEMQERVEDYLRFGVRYVWILDPRTRKAYRCTSESTYEVKELVTENPATLVPVEALFEE